VSAQRPPRTLEQATALLGHYAQVDAQLASIEATRKTEIGRVNGQADAEATPLLAELEALSMRLQPWWEAHGAALAGKGRKSLQLGGCMIGSKAERARLGHGFENDDKAVEALRATRYGKQTTRVKYTLDRTATLKLMQIKGKTAAALGELGFRVDEGESFFVKRVEQAGTIAG
jgi:phage host-nuclease inhibitor protein Gam